MKLVRPNCRSQLTAEDFDFIRATLARSTKDSVALESLMLDPEMLDTILDQEPLLDAIQNHALALRISSHFYFYVLVRHTLLKSDLDDRALSDYVASLLVNFTRQDHQKELLPELKTRMHYLVDIVSEIEKVDYYHRFFLYAFLGNQTLFLSGLFPKHIKQREQRRATPRIRYFESMGRSHFKAARNHPLAKEFGMQDLYDDLYHSFHHTRKALNDLSDKLL